VKFSKHHSDLEFKSFVVAQVQGSIHRSDNIDGVVESLVKSKKYVFPLAVLDPWVAGGLAVAYFTDGRFHPDKDAEILDPDTALAILNSQDETEQTPAMTPPRLTPVRVATGRE
jgi:hypothetical protein